MFGEIYMEEVPVGILSPLVSDSVTLLSIVLSIILLIALSYIWSIQRQDKDDIAKLSNAVKGLSKKIKDLETMHDEKKPLEKTETILKDIPINIPTEPAIETQQPIKEQVKISNNPWTDFLESYNHIAASMAVPGQLKACENFVVENKLKILIYTGSMNFITAPDVKESRFWAWKLEESNKFVVVPNPMIKYDEDLHSHSGMKETFASNYENGNYTKYFVELPAILTCDENKNWKILEPGVIKLER